MPYERKHCVLVAGFIGLLPDEAAPTSSQIKSGRPQTLHWAKVQFTRDSVPFTVQANCEDGEIKTLSPMSSPKPSVDLFEPGDVPNVLSQIARLGEGLKAEFDLIAGRMSWLVISESFIFSAFATAVANYRPDHPGVGGLRFLLWVLPFVGIVLTIFVFVAVLAALSSIDKLKTQRDQMIAGLPAHLRIDLISARSPQQWWGDLPAYVLPPVLFLVWAVAYLFVLV